MSSAWRHLAAIPLMNAGHDRLSSFDFDCGAKIQVGQPQILNDVLPLIAKRHDITPSEVMHFQLARGWLWITSDEVPTSILDKRNVFAVCTELAEKLWNLAWWIDLAGGGENNYWRNGGNMHCAGVYLYSTDSPHLPGFRRPYIFSTPRPEYQDAPWSVECLTQADRLVRIFADPLRKPIPRLALVNDLRYVMTSWDARRMGVRFSLCCTALETLFVAPSERAYLWTPHIRRRVQQSCPSLAGFSDDFFERFQKRRADAVHRSGLDEAGTYPKHVLTEIQSEVLLRDGLLWASLNYDTVASAFESDAWIGLDSKSA